MDPFINTNVPSKKNVTEQNKIDAKLTTTPIPSYITPSGQKKVDAKILLHVAADFIGLGTGLEGGSWENSGRHLADSLKEIEQSSAIDLVDRSKLKEIIGTVDAYCENCKIIGELLEIRDYDKQLTALDHFVTDFSDKVKKLAPGERLFMPGGWVGAVTGHAIMHVIEKSKTGDGSYRFYSFNTGNGINFYHLRHRDQEGMTHFKTVQSLAEISEKNICSPTFLRSLFEMQVVPLELAYVGREPHMIYDAILPLLKGKETRLPSWTKEFFNSQRSGTCSWKCLIAYLKDALPGTDSKTLGIFLKYNTLKKFVESNPIEKQGNRDLVLVANAAEKLIRSLNKPKCPIPESAQKPIVAELREIKNQALEQKALNQPKISLKSSLIFEDQLPQAIPFSSPSDPIISDNQPITQELKLQPLASKPPLEREPITPGNVIQQLDRWGDYCAALYKEGSYTAARDSVNQILMDLPVATGIPHKDPFWDLTLKATDQKEDNLIYKVGRLITDIEVKATDREREQIILKITRLNNILYRCAFQLGTSGAEDLYASMHSYAIQIQLMASIIGFSSDYSNDSLPIGMGHCESFASQGRDNIRDQMMFNLFANDDALKDNIVHIGEILTTGSACISIKEFIRKHGDYSEMNMRGNSCKKEFLKDYTRYIYKKGKDLGVEDPSWDPRFATALTTDIGQRRLLPRFLAAINKHAYILYLFQSGKYFSMQNLREVDPEIPVFELCFLSTEAVLNSEDKDYNAMSNLSINGVGPIEKRMEDRGVRDNWVQTHIDDAAFKKIVETYADTYSRKFGNIIADRSLIDDPELQSIPYEERRELLMLSQTPPEMVIWQTLSYFAQYWDRLENKNAQALFDLLTTNHLNEEVHRNSGSLKTMLTFIEQGLQQFSPPEKLNGFLFCVDFGIKIHSKLQDIDSEKKEAFTQAFALWEKELRDRLLDSRFTSAQKQAMQVQLANIMLQQPYSKEQTAQVLLGAACQEATPMPFFLQENTLKRSLQEHLQKHRTHFLKELELDPKFATTVMNIITTTIFGPQAQDNSWKLSSYPYFVNETGSMIVNLLTGEARCQNAASSPLPQHVLKFTDYQDVFGNQNFSAKVENFKLFTFSKDNLLYRVELVEADAVSSLKIEVQLDGHWYRYVPKDVVAKLINPPLREGFTHWAAMEGHGQLLIKDAAMQTVYQGTLSQEKGLENLSPISNPKIVYNVATHPFLGQFEDKEQILNWSNKEGKLNKLEFPRYGLHFDFVRDDSKPNDLGKAMSKEFPGFHVKAQQELPTLPFLSHFLILKNDKGVKKVLIPQYEMVYDTDSERLNPVGKPVKLIPPAYMAIDLNAKLKPARLNGEQAVYLAYLALVDKDYATAKQYLDLFAKADSKGDLQLYLKLIGNWCFYNDRIPPKGPITQTLGLRAILMIYDKLRFIDPDFAKSSGNLYAYQVDNLFDDYLHNRTNATVYRLTDLEEKNLLQHLFAKGPLSTRNFARFARLQAGKPLEPEVFHPEGRLEWLPHDWDKQALNSARWDAYHLIRECKNPWDGAEAINNGLLTRPKDNFVPYFLDCCLHFANWNQEPNRSAALDQLKVMQLVKSEGANVMRDCLERIFEHPEYFKEQLDQLQTVRSDGLQWPSYRGQYIAAWFDKVVQRYEENLLEFPPPKRIEAKQQLPLKMPFASKPVSSIRLKEVEPLPLLGNQDVQVFFHSTPVSRQGRIPPLKPVPANPAANAQIEKINQQLDKFYADRSKNPVKQLSIDRGHIGTDKLAAMLRDGEKTVKDLLSALKKTILDTANAEPTEEQKFYFEKREAGGQKAPVKMDDLVALFFTGDPQAILDRCPTLNSATCHQLTEKIFQYLQESTRRQQIRRSQDVLNEILLLENYVNNDIKVEGVYYPSKQDATLLISDYEEQLAKEMLAKPAYDLHKQPEYLALEYFCNIRLRAPQVKTLSLLLSGEETGTKEAQELIVQLTMGSGKTKVLLPLLAMKMADGEKLPIVVVPPALLEVNKHDLAETSLKTFGQRPYVLDFHRNSSITPAELRFMLQSLQNCIVDKRYAIATPSSLKCLEIKFKELAFMERERGMESEDAQEQFQILGDILKLLKGHGTIILDEADTILEARRSEVNFPVGKAIKISQARITVEKELLEALLNDPCNKLVHLAENKQRDMKDADLKIVQEEFVDKILSKHSTTEEAAKLRPYFLEEKGAEVPSIKGHPHEQILTQAKEVATTLLPLVLKKSGNENYGRSHESQKRYAVPYVANNTPDERSEFGQVDEVMLYSGFISAQDGLEPYDVDFLIQEMLRKVRMEAKASHLPFQQTKAFDTCTTLFGIKNIFNVSQDDRTNAAESVKNDLSALLYWMDNFVYPDIKIHNQKLCANSLDLVDMVPHVCGFTGTPWNRLAFHQRLQHPEIEAEIDHPEDDIAILDAIWRNVEGDREEGAGGIHVINSETPTGFLEAIMNVPDVVCLLDTGAIMKGIPNKEAAEAIQKLIDQNSNLKGTLYFDEKNRIVVHFDGADPVTLDTVAIGERFSYYDQAHTTGSDIKQSPRAKAVLTFSHNTVRDMTQGAMRMRRLLSSQAIELLVPRPTAEKIHAEGKPAFNDLLTSAIIHQSNRLVDDIDYSTRQKLRHISSRKLSDLLISCETLKDAVKIVEKFEPLLSDISSNEPSFKIMKPTLETLEAMRQQQIKEIQALFERAEDLPQHLKDKVEPLKAQIMRELEEFVLPDPTLLPELRPESAVNAAKTESRVEIEKEIEVNEESQRGYREREYYAEWGNELYEPHNFPSYKPDFLDPGTSYEFAPKVISLQEVFESSDDLRKFDGVFDPLLRTTRNFVTTLKAQKELAFVEDAQKRCCQLVMVKDKDSVAALMVDPVEAGWLRKVLPVKKQEEVIKSINTKLNKEGGPFPWSGVQDAGIRPYDRQVCILDLENGFQELMGPEFTAEEQKRMVELTAQAKFYNGYLVYSDAEWDYLKHWVADSGKAPLMKELFEKSVHSHPGQHKFYEQSNIHKLLA